MDPETIQAAASVPRTGYGSFAEATGHVLDALQARLPRAAVFLATLEAGRHRVVDSRLGPEVKLRADVAVALAQGFCDRAVQQSAPAVHNAVPRLAPYGRGGSCMTAPILSPTGERVATLGAVARARHRFDADELRLLSAQARMLAYESEREQRDRDLHRLNDSLRDQGRGMAAIARVARELAAGADARMAVCEAAREITRAPVVCLLERSGGDFVSTVTVGGALAPVSIKVHDERPLRAGTFVADARVHPSINPSLASSTGARSALFEPVLREGIPVGVIVVIWTTQLQRLPDHIAGVMRLLAGEAAVALEQAGLHGRVRDLAHTDALTGLVSRRVWETELPRELARARRQESPLCLAMIGLDGFVDYAARGGEQAGERALKASAAAWLGALREVDLLARLGPEQFAVALPSCDLYEATEVLDRVRAATPSPHTASAGVVRWQEDELPETVMARCAAALAAAQAAGRDLTISED